jgi:hypothetical protein
MQLETTTSCKAAAAPSLAYSGSNTHFTANSLMHRSGAGPKGAPPAATVGGRPTPAACASLEFGRGGFGRLARVPAGFTHWLRCSSKLLTSRRNSILGQPRLHRRPQTTLLVPLVHWPDAPRAKPKPIDLAISLPWIALHRYRFGLGPPPGRPLQCRSRLDALQAL